MKENLILATAGLLVLLSWFGWGAALFRILGIHQRLRAGWPLLAAAGMSVFLCYGGILNCLGQTGAITLGATTIAGAFFGTIALWNGRHRSLTAFRRAAIF